LLEQMRVMRRSNAVLIRRARWRLRKETSALIAWNLNTEH
jgi:hypothetical protein